MLIINPKEDKMKVLIIIVCVVLYLVMWVVTGALLLRRRMASSKETVFFGMFWPIFLPFTVIEILINYANCWLKRR